MKRSARQRKKETQPGLLRKGLGLASSAVARNPGIAGGGTAFLVAFFYVAANALWYQPHSHRGAFFPTRDLAYQAPEVNETTIRIERRPVHRDPLVADVQGALATLELYTGAIDGVVGPRTKEAVEAYQEIAGIPVTGKIDDELAARLRQDSRPAVGRAITSEREQAAPTPRFRPAQASADEGRVPLPDDAVREAAGNEEEVLTASTDPAAAFARPGADPDIVRIQAGLRAFGNDGIELDGVVGEKTRAAIREFQTLFGLPVTGEPDARLLAKMREIGLTN